MGQALRDAVEPAGDGVDLAGFDAMATDLHLMVDPPLVVDVTVLVDEREVAGAVETPCAVSCVEHDEGLSVRSGRWRYPWARLIPPR